MLESSPLTRRHSQEVRQRSAKPLSPVRFRVAPPKEIPGRMAGYFLWKSHRRRGPGARAKRRAPGPHSPPGDREARFPGSGRANLRRRRNSGRLYRRRGAPIFRVASRGKLAKRHSPVIARPQSGRGNPFPQTAPCMRQAFLLRHSPDRKARRPSLPSRWSDR